MRTRKNGIPAALQHGIYSTIGVLPGEDPAAFNKLCRALITEFAPKGALEDDIVTTMARLVWRKQNLKTLHVARRAQTHLSNVLDEMVEAKFHERTKTRTEVEELSAAAEDRVRGEFGAAYALVEIGEAASFDALERDLALEERIDSMIERCLKRLLYLHGLKSVSGTIASGSARRVAGPSEAP